MAFKLFKSPDTIKRIRLSKEKYNQIQARMIETDETIKSQQACHDNLVKQYDKIIMAIQSPNLNHEDKFQYVNLRRKFDHAITESSKILEKLNGQLDQFKYYNNYIQQSYLYN